MTSCYNAVEHMYDERNKLIIIGLTGRTGSGCSTVAGILAKSDAKKLDLPEAPSCGEDIIENRKNLILNNYILQPNKWLPFTKIDVSSLILYFVFKQGKEALSDYIKKIQLVDNKIALRIIGTEDICEAISCFNDIFDVVINDKYKKKDSNNKGEATTENSTAVKEVKFYTNTILKYRDRFKSLLEEYQCFVVEKTEEHGHSHKRYNLYTFLMQQFANNLRASGNPFNDEFDPSQYTVLPEKISEIIEFLVDAAPKDKPVRVCVDAIRNPYEALYLRDKYKAFYLISINTDENSRLRRLANLTKDEIENLDIVEYGDRIDTPEKSFYHQNIQGCIEIATIHIHNKDVQNNKYFDLTQQIVRYLALIQHPGLVTPTSIERCMQIAYNAKLNSGCLSRQVGAVVTRTDFSIQSVGWNDVPKGQVSCNLRDVHDFCVNRNHQLHSKYELENKQFLKVMEAVDEQLSVEKEKKNKDEQVKEYCDMNTPYCFKDIYQGITGEKNQVHTRALHAEENAFLQITKYGGTGVKGGYLFTTASPCELCSKKAYQLGISKIFYIDPYPGISKEHILSFGNNNNPEMVLFQGAIGESYVELYRPRIPIKDESEMRTDIKIKKVAKELGGDNKLPFKDIEYKYSLVELKFNSRTDVETKRVLEFVPKKEESTFLNKTFEWTESSFDSIDLIEDDTTKGITLQTIKTKSPATYRIDFENAQPENGAYKYGLIIKAKDEKKLMEQVVEHIVLYKTECLELRLVFPLDLLEKVDYVEYADFKGEVEYLRKNIKYDSESDVKENDTHTVVSLKDGICTVKEVITNPRINYKYAIEWKFKEK